MIAFIGKHFPQPCLHTLDNLNYILVIIGTQLANKTCSRTSPLLTAVKLENVCITTHYTENMSDATKETSERTIRSKVRRQVDP